MRLAEFIRENIEEISSAWEKFAGTLLPEEEFSRSVLRNSIADLLYIVADDMDQTQSGDQQQQKSEGRRRSQSMMAVSERHVLDRVAMGLSSRQLISEFRALRASVIRLWQEDKDIAHKEDLQDLIRFNEAIDEALIEAEVRYTQEMDQSRELFLGILGHDLRNPLQAIAGSAEMIRRTKQQERNAVLADQILVSVARMSHMIADLIGLTRVKLGKGIPIHPVSTNLRDISLKVIGEMEAIYPDRVFRLDAEDDIQGEWDEQKLSQVLANLLANAVQHGSPDSEIIIRAKKIEEGVELQVHNHGPAISKKLITKIFDRFVQEKPGKDGVSKSGSMGLGLYIAKEIVAAHGGTIKARSSEEEGTTFFACLPQSVPQSHFRSL